MSAPELPIVRLKPKCDARPIRHGYPWVFSDQIVTDRRTRSIAPGSLAVLEDAGRAPLALVAVNGGSRIALRVLDRDPAARIDRAWMDARLQQALALRTRLYDAPYYRLVHAEADGFPGVIVDRFGEAAVIQPNAAWAEARLDELAESLADVSGITTLVKSASGRARALEGLDDAGGVLRGTLDGPIPVPMNGAIYMADLEGGQKTGLFYDQRPNHAFIAGLARGAHMLDLFSHVGGFGLAALAAGAAHVTAVDGSAPALALAEQGAAAMKASDRLDVVRSDAFDALTTLNEEGRQFEVVVCDPPAFAPNRQALQQGLRAYERLARMAASTVAPGGFLTLCSCSHAADLEKFRAACVRGIGRSGRAAQLIHTGFAGPDHPVHPQLAESGYLKALTFRLA